MESESETVKAHGRWIGLAIVMVVVLGIGALVATRGTGDPSRPQPTTLDAALASFATATDYYLRIPTIPGDSTVQGHVNDIDVQTFGWGVTGSSTGRAAFGDVTITKYVDPASPPLMRATAAGLTFTSVTLFAEKPGSTPFEYYRLTLANAKVKSFKQSGTRAAGILDTVAFGYTRITLRHVKQLPTGGTSIVQNCWDLTANAAC
jgi:type VI secretion system secreted protein Hcp